MSLLNFPTRRLVGPLAALALLASFTAAPAQTLEPALKTAIDSPQRAEKNRARDIYRHPSEALSFFGVKPDSTIVEILPGASGYWTEILAPYLKDKGHYIAANGEAASTSEEVQKDNAAFQAKFVAAPERYGKIEVSEFAADKHPIAAPGSADFVLTFRNLHNWMAHGETADALEAFYDALKPGGVLGIVDHRGDPNAPQDPLAKSGYVRQDFAIQLIEAAGFKFVGASEANANPKDAKDYSVGVWALPPTYRLKDVDHDKFAAIGESDRFTLKFVKP